MSTLYKSRQPTTILQSKRCNLVMPRASITSNGFNLSPLVDNLSIFIRCFHLCRALLRSKREKSTEIAFFPRVFFFFSYVFLTKAQTKLMAVRDCFFGRPLWSFWDQMVFMLDGGNLSLVDYRRREHIFSSRYLSISLTC